jgi:hypothetical protein
MVFNKTSDAFFASSDANPFSAEVIVGSFSLFLMMSSIFSVHSLSSSDLLP